VTSVFYKGRFTEAAGSWDELSASQLRQAVAILTGPYLPEVKRLRLLKVLLRWSWWKIALAMGMLRFWDLPEQKSGLRRLQLFGKAVDRTARLAEAAEELTRFFFEGNTITRNIIPEYKGFFGPADALANMRMAEFCFSENYYLLWKQTQETKYLNLLISCLWRPGKKNAANEAAGDYRTPFNPAMHNTMAARVNKWPADVKLAMAMIYDGMRAKKISDNPKVFSDAEPQGETVFGLWSIMRSVAKAGHFGDFDKVQHQYLDTILMELTEASIEAERLEEQMETMKTEHA
jgi:hypothetical protein